jgi:hypothetical protein
VLATISAWPLGTWVRVLRRVVDPASLQRSAEEYRRDRGSQAGVGVGDNQPDTRQSTGLEGAQERRPARAGLAVHLLVLTCPTTRQHGATENLESLRGHAQDRVGRRKRSPSSSR